MHHLRTENELIRAREPGNFAQVLSQQLDNRCLSDAIMVIFSIGIVRSVGLCFLRSGTQSFYL